MNKEPLTTKSARKFTGYRPFNPNGIYTTKQLRHSGKIQMIPMIVKRWPCKTPKVIVKRIYHDPALVPVFKLKKKK